MARLLLILHSILNIALGIYPFINAEEYSNITGVEAPDRALQSIGMLSSYIPHCVRMHISLPPKIIPSSISTKSN
jgi:hypothetical protein